VADARRTVHVVPGSSERFLAKAASLDADMLVLDLEDAVAPAEKGRARGLVVEALRSLDVGERLLSVRVNPADGPHAHRDLIALVEGAGARLDTIVLPKVSSVAVVAWADLLLGQLELEAGLPPGAIGIDAQIEDPQGLVACEAIAAAPRVRALHFGPGDFAAAMGIPGTTIGGATEAFAPALARIVVAARAAGAQAIDGPYGDLGDEEGLRTRAAFARSLGLDGKWTIHPGQIATVNAAFTPSSEEVQRAEALLAAYEQASAGEGRGAARFEGEMVDEASRRMAERIVGAARAARHDGTDG
jgi:citrate lyase subunit beta / citryl-CoA lyase